MRVLVIGGGIVGLTIVRELNNAGVKDIVLLERGMLGKEASYAAAGMLAPQAESNEDDAFFRLCCAGRDFYPQFAEAIKEESGVDIELDRAGTLCLAFNRHDESELTKRFKWQSAAGLGVQRLTAGEINRLEPNLSRDSAGALYFPDDWQVENRALLKGLILSLNSEDLEIHANTVVKSFKPDGFPAVETEGGKTIEGDIIILATGAWTSFIETGSQSLRLPEIRPVKGQMISFRGPGRFISKVIYSGRGYLVPRRNGKILAGATVEDAGFDREVTEKGIEQLRSAAVEIAPSISNFDMDERWAGLRPRCADGLPVIGKIGGAENLYISSGHYRNGILLAPLTAKLLVDSILSRGDSEILKTFGPERIAAAAV